MIPEASRWEEFKSQWPYLLTIPPLLSAWADLVGFEGGWTGCLVDVVVVVTTLAMVVVIQTQRRELKESAITDKLTGLFNSRHLRVELDRQTALAQRVRTPLSMVFMDMDGFKAFNDRHGHAMGDQLLRGFGLSLLATVREHVDLCFRFGGDEFLILCPHTHIDEAAGIAQRVLESPASAPEVRGENITLSLGVVQLREGESARQFLERADRVMYRAKQAGKNRLCLDA